MTNNQLTSTHLAVKSELDGYKIHASRGQATALAMVRLFESIDKDLKELQERRKAERDSEPVAYWRKAFRADGFCYADGINSKRYHDENPPLPLRNGNYWEVIPLYRHAQPAPEYPEVLPCSVLLEPGMRFGKGVKTRLVLEAIQRRAEHHAELEAMTPEERAEYDAGIEAFKAMLPQPAPIVEREPIAWLNDAYLARGVVDGEAGSEDAGPGYIPVYREAGPQPAQVVPEEATPDSIEILASGRCRDHAVFQWDEDQRNAAADSWNAFRAAMLQELKKSAGTEAICRSDENVQVLHTKSPAQSDCCPAQNVVVPAQSPIDHGYLPECECSGCKATARICTEMAVNSLVIPNEMTSEQAYEIGYYYGDPVDVFARGANWMRQHIIDSTLAAAPQSPGSEPATVSGKWIPVSERMPEMGEKQRYVLAADFKNNYWPNIPNTQVGVYGDWFDDGNPTWDDGDGEDLHLKEVTHWMQLPAAPQEVSRG